MTDDEFDVALVAAAFELGAEKGWQTVSAGSACHRAGLDLTTARQRFPTRTAILEKFGEIADEQALRGAVTEGPVRDRLFDILLRRFDHLQAHRPGVLALMKSLPLDPGLAVWLAGATLRSMGWMLEGVGVSGQGPRGAVRAQGLLAVWGWAMRAWMSDDTADLSGTMAAVDTALNRADQFAARYDNGGAQAVVADAAMADESLADIVLPTAAAVDMDFPAEPGAPTGVA